jgi:molecular chaperone IbpA
MTMVSFDLSPLYRHTVGFDHMASLLDGLTHSAQGNGYPPYNIEVTGDDQYRITMAVAGFAEDDLDLEVKENVLTVSGKKEDSGERRYLHRGIAGRNFEHRFQLADHVKVAGARLENGLLNIDLVREIPEAMKPRRIEIETGKSGRLLDADKAA